MQSEVADIKGKLVSFVNSMKEEAESIYQDKFSQEDFPASAKRKLGKESRIILDDFCSGSCVGHASTMLTRQMLLQPTHHQSHMSKDTHAT